MGPQVAVLIPCHNEETTIAKVVRDFCNELPEAAIYVYDNNSTDDTFRAARMAGAIVCTERLQGKGHVVRRMFADVDADIYVLVDGDDTYDAGAVRTMVQTLIDLRCDMVTGMRVTDAKQAYRFGHRFGNVILTTIVRQIFGGPHPGHAVGVQGLQPPLRQVVSGTRHGIRDGNGVYRACAGTENARR